MTEKHRCAWVAMHPLYPEHHDTEWGVPVLDGRTLWEHLVLDTFQAGLSWATVLGKRDAFRVAFSGFEPEAVARYGAKDVERLVADAGIIRSRAKIQAAIVNARAYQAMAAAGEDFSTFVWSFVDGRPIPNRWSSPEDVPTQTPLAADIATALKARGFEFVGPVMVYAWMQAVGLVNDHVTGCFRHAQCAALAKKMRATSS